MCHLPFNFVKNFFSRRFLSALRPKFNVMMGSERIQRRMAGPLLDEVYEDEAVQVSKYM